MCVYPAAKSPCSPTERRVSRSTQSYGSFTITPFTTSKENLPVLNTRIICPGKHTYTRTRPKVLYVKVSVQLIFLCMTGWVKYCNVCVCLRVCVQACGRVWLPPSLAAPSLARCCWRTSTPSAPLRSSTPTWTRCKSRHPSVSCNICPHVSTSVDFDLFVCLLFDCELTLPFVCATTTERATWRSVWWTTTLASAWTLKSPWSLTTRERSIRRNAGETHNHTHTHTPLQPVSYSYIFYPLSTKKSLVLVWFLQRTGLLFYKQEAQSKHRLEQ